MILDSRIVQLCYQEDLLLVSTATRCYLCDTVKEQYKQIGQQLRDGLYGTTFFKNQKKLFCARPGSRLWEVDAEGVVYSTHQFKKQLSVPPSAYVSIFEDPKVTSDAPTGAVPDNSVQPLNFAKLYDFADRYIITFNAKAIYALNIETVDVLFWNNCFGHILDVQCTGNSIFVWNADGNLFELALLPVQKCLLTLYFRKHYDLCALLIEIFFEKLVSREELLRELLPLRDLEVEDTSSEENDKMEKKINPVAMLREKLNSVANADLELRSGIHIVHNKHLSRLLLDDTSLLKTMNYRDAANDESPRKRSNSLPSEFKRNSSSGSQSGSNIYTCSSDAKSRPSQYGDEFLMFDNLLTDATGVAYNSPFITLASYDILREHFSELGTSFSEIFSEGSKNLKKKLGIFENKVPSPVRRNEKLDFVLNARNDDTSNEIEEPQILEPVVDINNDQKKKKQLRKDAECPEITALCEEYEEAENFELLNGVLRHYTQLSEKYNFGPYRGFPFSIEEKWLTGAAKVFSKIMTKEFLLKWFKRDEFSALVESNFLEKYPEFLRQVFTAEELKLDYSLCKVLILFSELLNVTDILETLESLRFPCYYESFCFILKYFQNGNILERSSYSRGENTRWPMPVYLNTMLLMISVDQKDVFCEMGSKKNVDLTYIGYMMLHLEHLSANEFSDADAEFEGSTLQYRDIWLMYVQKQYQKDANCFNNENILRLVTKVFLSKNENFETRCCFSCWFLLPQTRVSKINFPVVGRAILQRFWRVFESIAKSSDSPYSQEVLLLLRQAIGGWAGDESPTHPCYMNAESCDHVLCREFRTRVFRDSNDGRLLLIFNIICRFCYQIPELWKQLVTLQEDSEIKILYPQHFIQLKDTSQLESYFPQINLEDARMILNWMLLMAKGNCLNCDAEMPSNSYREVSWNDIALFILRRLGGKQTLKILAEYQEFLKLDMRLVSCKSTRFKVFLVL